MDKVLKSSISCVGYHLIGIQSSSLRALIMDSFEDLFIELEGFEHYSMDFSTTILCHTSKWGSLLLTAIVEIRIGIAETRSIIAFCFNIPYQIQLLSK
jgi:hypothetical protein